MNEHSELKSYPGYKVLITTFVRKFVTTDTTNQDVNIGKDNLICSKNIILKYLIHRKIKQSISILCKVPRTAFFYFSRDKQQGNLGSIYLYLSGSSLEAWVTIVNQRLMNCKRHMTRKILKQQFLKQMAIDILVHAVYCDQVSRS